jgi:prepilin-type processing-associated H-X9-DG protein
MKSACISRQRQLMLGIMMYIQDYDEVFPSTANMDTPNKIMWTQTLLPYAKRKEDYVCPYAGVVTNFLGYRSQSTGVYVDKWKDRNLASIGLTTQFILDKTDKEGFNKGIGVAALEKPNSTVILADTPNLSENMPSANSVYEGGYMFDPCAPQSVNGVPPILERKYSFLSTQMPLKSMRGPLAARHQGGVNIGFADGHVKWQSKNTLRSSKDLVWRFRGCP